MPSLQRAAIALIGILALVSFGSKALASPPQKYEQIHQLFYACEQGVRPGYAIGITRSGKLEFAKDYGVSTYMVHLPERQQSVICLANFANGDCGAKVRAILDILLL
jgi:hypothetical protein